MLKEFNLVMGVSFSQIEALLTPLIGVGFKIIFAA